MAIDTVGAVADRLGGTLARQAADVGGGLRVPMFDEGVIPPFRAGAGEFQAALNGNVTLSRVGGLRRGRGHLSVNPVGSPGESIVDSIQSVRKQYETILGKVQEWSKKKEDLSIGDLLDMQFHVMQLAYLNEFSSKVADKSSQGAQTLFRNQG
jgi:hypothetical protein